jgi:hypothetical protein
LVGDPRNRAGIQKKMAKISCFSILLAGRRQKRVVRVRMLKL